MRPFIGITVDSIHEPGEPRTHGKLSLNWNYAQAIADAGGNPLLIPPMADMEAVAKIIDGWLIPGGNDIDAARFGEENHETVKTIDPARYEGEERLYQTLAEDVPVFGICYGCQFLNVARGGTLIQHLPDVVEHEAHAGGTLERYEIDESRLQEAIGQASIEGKSYHHQAVKSLGANLRVVARAGDGIVEAVEATDRPWLIGVQWHPERTLEDPATRRLFESFVNAARRRAESRETLAPR
ncbi:MAG TPA: gamma-glutamyl-gamma-aminobutyrate hydrolase family protein [Fimbriimonadaceae bacterium]|nr:gamma-glutamyl-gamma-aminobutyrate hydrolase family protein [Fimbriimonadaceae bacterium]